MAERKAKIGVGDLNSFNNAQKAIIQLYDKWGKPEKVAEWRAKFQANRQ